jgi:hypothetical protein
MINRIVARPRPVLAGTLVALAAAALAGCGTAGSTPAVPTSAAAEMDTHLKAVQSSADRDDRAGASAELNAFAGDIARARSAGELSGSEYAALETGIARTRARIGVELAATPPASTTTPATPSVGASLPVIAPTPQAPTPQTPAPHAPKPAPGGVKAVKGAGPAKDGHGHGKGDG